MWPGQAASQVTSLADRPSCRLQLWPLPHVGEDQAVPGPTSKRLPPEHPCARDRASAHARELHRASRRTQEALCSALPTGPGGATGAVGANLWVQLLTWLCLWLRLPEGQVRQAPG